MSKKTVVCCHSPSLAFLLYETNCAEYNQLGLLLGNVINDVIKSTTDANDANEEKTTKIYVEHSIPFPRKFKFNAYGHLNDLNEKLMDRFCAPFKGKIIGWYSFRRNLKSNYCSLRENLLHQSFLNYFKLEPEHFIVGLISTNVHAGRFTHDFNYHFLRFTKKTYEGLKLKIYCLSDKSSGYITNPSFPVPEELGRIQGSSKKQSAVENVKEMHKLSVQKLSDLNLNLQECEIKRNKLEKEICELRESLRKKVPLNINIISETPLDTIIPFDPNYQYIYGIEHPIKPSIYEEININPNENSDGQGMIVETEVHDVITIDDE